MFGWLVTFPYFFSEFRNQALLLNHGHGFRLPLRQPFDTSFLPGVPEVCVHPFPLECHFRTSDLPLACRIHPFLTVPSLP